VKQRLTVLTTQIDRLQSAAALNSEIPPVTVAKASDFFDQVRETTEGGATLPSWRGELYFELHRGVSFGCDGTNGDRHTQANLKKGNRKMETTLRDAEYFATLASLHDSKFRYPW
jgi:alpha-mannosidase